MEIVGSRIGEFSVSLRPHVLGWIELWGVRRKVMHVEPGMVGQEHTDFAAPMNGATVPEQIDGAPQMAKQVLEEGTDVEAAEIARTTPEIECHAPPLGRDGQPATDREAIVPIAMADAWGLALGRPGAADVGDEQKPTLIDEREMGATSSGVF